MQTSGRSPTTGFVYHSFSAQENVLPQDLKDLRPINKLPNVWDVIKPKMKEMELATRYKDERTNNTEATWQGKVHLRAVAKRA